MSVVDIVRDACMASTAINERWLLIDTGGQACQRFLPVIVIFLVFFILLDSHLFLIALFGLLDQPKDVVGFVHIYEAKLLKIDKRSIVKVD